MANKQQQYRSKFEESFANGLRENGVAFEYESAKIPYVIEHIYNPDWKIQKSSGDYFYVETKGVLDADDRRKMLAVKRQHPNIDIRIIFQKASNPIRKGSKTTYAAWAEKNGFLWSEKTIPNEWING